MRYLHTALATALFSATVHCQSIQPLSPAQKAALAPFAHFAAAAYCTAAQTSTWSCGPNCSANSDFHPISSGGDGGRIQYWYVGYSPGLNTAIVGYQGLDSSNLMQDLADTHLQVRPLDEELFPGIPSTMSVYSGFADAHARTAGPILAAVKKTLSQYNTNTVTIVGDSFGGALASLDSIYLQIHLPASVTVRAVTFGQPRVGNQAFADYMDAHCVITRISNKKDPFAILPSKASGFAHSSGEVHITESGEWVSCPGQDNPSADCSTGDVPSIHDGNPDDHKGPYDGVEMRC